MALKSNNKTLPFGSAKGVITLTNMSILESPLGLEKTIEAIYIEEMRLKLFEPIEKQTGVPSMIPFRGNVPNICEVGTNLSLVA